MTCPPAPTNDNAITFRDEAFRFLRDEKNLHSNQAIAFIINHVDNIVQHDKNMDLSHALIDLPDPLEYLLGVLHERYFALSCPELYERDAEWLQLGQ
jgi:hypothetical protein